MDTILRKKRKKRKKELSSPGIAAIDVSITAVWDKVGDSDPVKIRVSNGETVTEISTSSEGSECKITTSSATNSFSSEGNLYESFAGLILKLLSARKLECVTIKAIGIQKEGLA